MSNNIPFEIQTEIMKRLPVKPLIQFRSVSKPWKSFIDSSEFIKGYGARHTQPHSHILSLSLGSEDRFICLVDDETTFKVQQQEFAPFVVSPLLKQYHVLYVVGACRGLLCLFCYNKYNYRNMLVIWNPCIGKSFVIALPSFLPKSQAYSRNQLVFGFGVCPVDIDPTIVKIKYRIGMPWHVQVFTLSSRVWNVIPSGNLPRLSIKLNPSTQVVIGRFIYWGAREKTFTDDGESTMKHMIVSFDLITKEFKVVDLPNSLTNELYSPVSVSKLRESLVVSGYIVAEEAVHCGVWVMERDSSFRKLFSIGASFCKLLGFRKNGEPIFEIRKADGEDGQCTTLNVYDPCSQIKNLGISGEDGSFFLGSYKESLLLLDHLDSHIYYDNN